MYDQSDPRTALAPAPSSSKPAATRFAGAEYGRFYDSPPQAEDADGRSWYFRGQNFVLHYMEAKAGALLAREDQVDEYALMLPDADSEVEIEADGEKETVTGGHLAFVPPGASSVRIVRAGRIVRLVTTRATDLVAKCANEHSYRQAHPNIPPFEAWPAPRGGYKIRAYPLDS